MIEKKQVLINDLALFGPVGNLNEQAKTMVAHQKQNWPVVQKNFDALYKIQNRTFDFGHFKIKTQFNPGRIRSSAAKTDAISIATRPCFLCLKNLPKEQSGLVFQSKYLVLVNPFPIFPVHLTISHQEHTLQEIHKYFPEMLDLSKMLSDFTVFYNGPKTGASAPDHFHFQGIIKNSLPIETEFEILKKNFSEIVFQDKKTKVIAIENYLRNFISIISDDKSEIEKIFNVVYKNIPSQDNTEPMLNVLSSFRNEQWRIIIFPRAKQRPEYFFFDDERQIISSPASVEMGGILVLPREEDFRKITKKEIQTIYKEVTIKREDFENLKLCLKDKLK